MRFAIVMVVLVVASVLYFVDMLTDSPVGPEVWLTKEHRERLAEAVSHYNGWTAACVALDRARFPVTVPKGERRQYRRLLADGVTLEVMNVVDATGSDRYREMWKGGAFCHVPE